jgi:hypothetical protein
VNEGFAVLGGPDTVTAVIDFGLASEVPAGP